MPIERARWPLHESYRPDEAQKSWVPDGGPSASDELPETVDIGGGTIVAPPRGDAWQEPVSTPGEPPPAEPAAPPR